MNDTLLHCVHHVCLLKLNVFVLKTNSAHSMVDKAKNTLSLAHLNGTFTPVNIVTYTNAICAMTSQHLCCDKGLLKGDDVVSKCVVEEM